MSISTFAYSNEAAVARTRALLQDLKTTPPELPKSTVVLDVRGTLLATEGTDAGLIRNDSLGPSNVNTSGHLLLMDSGRCGRSNGDQRVTQTTANY